MNTDESSNLCQFKQRLEEKEIQVSAPRLAIANFVLKTESHPTAEEVKHNVEKFFPMVSLATVYNTLNLFVEKGLLKALRDPASETLRYDCNLEPHFHFYDEDEKRLMDLDGSSIKIPSADKLIGEDYEISSVEVLLRGRSLNPKSKTKENHSKKG